MNELERLRAIADEAEALRKLQRNRDDEAARGRHFEASKALDEIRKREQRLDRMLREHRASSATEKQGSFL